MPLVYTFVLTFFSKLGWEAGPEFSPGLPKTANQIKELLCFYLFLKQVFVVVITYHKTVIICIYYY